MQTVTLISTKHSNLGKCTSNALLDIFQSIHPEVFFAELPETFFNLYYGDSPTNSSLESAAITAFLKSSASKQVLVDTIDWPFLQAFKECYKKVLEDCFNLPTPNGFLLTQVVKNKERSVFDLGFNYLNSRLSELDQSKISSAIMACLVQMNNKDGFEIVNEWQKYNDYRENQMIKNIYKFSEDNAYKNAVFTLGVAHRKSIKDKIMEFEKKNEGKVNWKCYGE